MKSDESTVVRKAIGADRWFPANPKTLKTMVDTFVSEAEVPALNGRIVSCIAPHAGFVHSGKVAGHVFRALKDAAAKGEAPETAVILGFSHSAGFRGVSVMDGDAIRTPLGTTPLDREAAELVSKTSERIQMDYGPHAGEHSAENEVPFVQESLPKAKLLIALIGDHDMATVDDLVKALQALAKTKKIVVIASSDMLHDPDYDLVSKTDRETLKKVEALDIEGVLRSWGPHKQTFCGIMAVAAAMRFAETQGCKAGKTLIYRNSGDNDPRSRGHWVVGYGAVVFTAE